MPSTTNLVVVVVSAVRIAGDQPAAVVMPVGVGRGARGARAPIVAAKASTDARMITGFLP